MQVVLRKIKSYLTAGVRSLPGLLGLMGNTWKVLQPRGVETEQNISIANSGPACMCSDCWRSLAQNCQRSSIPSQKESNPERRNRQKFSFSSSTGRTGNSISTTLRLTRYTLSGYGKPESFEWLTGRRRQEKPVRREFIVHVATQSSWLEEHETLNWERESWLFVSSFIGAMVFSS